MNKSTFKSAEFEKRLENIFERISNYIIQTNYKLEKLKIKELVQWHYESQKGPVRIYPHTECPHEIKVIIERIIIEEFDK
jgi:hypothetical protein